MAMNRLSMCCKEDLIYLGYGRNILFSFALGNLYHYCCSKCGCIEWSTQKYKCKYKWYKYDIGELRKLLGLEILKESDVDE